MGTIFESIWFFLQLVSDSPPEPGNRFQYLLKLFLFKSKTKSGLGSELSEPPSERCVIDA